jgi:hypothetical protein
MFGLVVLAILAAYFLISLIAVNSAIVWAGRLKRSRIGTNLLGSSVKCQMTPS